MFLKILLNFLAGFIKIKIEGYYIERFINLCIGKKILLWNLKREKSTIVYANIGINNFKQIKQIAKKTNCKVKIEEKKGMPFLLNKYKKRKIFLILFLIVIITIFTLSNFVWNIEIKCDTNMDTANILNELKEYGIKTGILKSKINTKEVINRLRLKHDDIAWVGLKIEGTNVICEIVEADKKPEIINESEYCNIVAEKPGIITKINVQDGTAKVNIGDIIKPGTILVEGSIEGKYTPIRYVHSKAEIEARVWYSKKEKMSLTTTENRASNNLQNVYYIKLNNLKINFNKSIPKFKNYDTINEEKKLKIFSNFYLPIQLGKTTYKEMVKTNKTFTEEEAKQFLENKLKEQLNSEIGNTKNIYNTKTNIKFQNNQIEVEVIYEVLENIGTKEKITL